MQHFRFAHILSRLLPGCAGLVACSALVACAPAAKPCPRVGPPPAASCAQPNPAAPGHSGGTAIGGDASLARVFSGAGLDSKQLRCTTFVSWEPTLNRYAKAMVQGLVKQWSVTPDAAARKRARHFVLGYLVRNYFDLARPHNLGAVALRGLSYTDDKGHKRPLLLIRSAVTIGAPQQACFESLITHAAVRHVVNLYGGTFPFYDVIDAEKKLASSRGIDYFDVAQNPQLKFRGLIEEAHDYDKNVKEAEKRLAQLINERLLRPGGKAPRGNLYVHCCGGMHRSGMIFGVLRRCINGDSMEAIEKEYRRHVAFTDAGRPGGFEPLNLKFIREFDCRRIGGAKQ